MKQAVSLKQDSDMIKTLGKILETNLTKSIINNIVLHK